MAINVSAERLNREAPLAKWAPGSVRAGGNGWLELSGDVEAVGRKVQRFVPGDAVFTTPSSRSSRRTATSRRGTRRATWW